MKEHKGRKGKGYQLMRTIKILEHKNTRSDFKCCDYRKKRKTVY